MGFTHAMSLLFSQNGKLSDLKPLCKLAVLEYQSTRDGTMYLTRMYYPT